MVVNIYAPNDRPSKILETKTDRSEERSEQFYAITVGDFSYLPLSNE